MKLLILAPKVTSPRAFREAAEAAPDLVYLADPLAQNPEARKAGLSRIVTDDDFLPQSSDLESLISMVKGWARGWHAEDGVRDAALHRGVRCAELTTQQFTIDLLTWTKPVFIYMKLFSKYPVTSVEVFGGGPWAEAARFVAKRRGAAYAARAFDRAPAAKKAGGGWKDAVKALLSAISKRARGPRRGGILYSSAYRYAGPLLRKSGGAYLRDTFSFAAFFRSLPGKFSHILPEYYAAAGETGASLSAGLASAAEARFDCRPYFVLEGENLWPLFKGGAFAGVLRDVERATKLIDRLAVMFDEIAPRAVVVDEEVCLFNKTLVHAAKARGIPAFSLVHGEPYDDIGSVPSSCDRILAWGPASSRRLREWGVDGRKIAEVGAPQFARLEGPALARARRAVERRFGVPKNARIALFAAYAFDTNEKPTFTRPAAGIDLQRRSTRIMIEMMRRHPEVSVIVKFHPHETHRDFTERLLAEAEDVRPRVRLVDNYDASRLVMAADLVVSIVSSIYPEALVFKKPSLAFTSRALLRPSAGPRSLLWIEDAPRCAAELDRYLDPRNLPEILRLQESQIADYFVDGNRGAADRALEEIASCGRLERASACPS